MAILTPIKNGTLIMKVLYFLLHSIRFKVGKLKLVYPILPVMKKKELTQELVPDLTMVFRKTIACNRQF